MIRAEAALLAASLLVGLYVWRVDVGRYSILTVGSFRRVSRSSVREPDHACRDCGDEIHRGERRRYFKEFVVLGAPIARYGGGVSRYCERHADLAVRDELEPVAAHQLPGWLVDVVAIVPADRALEAESAEHSAFEDVVSSSSGAIGVFPMVLVAIPVVALVSIFQGWCQ